MTLITFQDGQPVMRDGKVGTGQGCCCGDGGYSRCIRNGEWDCQYTTQESCEECVRVRKCFEVLQTKCDGTCPNGGTPPPASITITGAYDSCFSWTQATGTAAIGCGKVIAASVTDGGGGFARLGRTAPTLTASAEQGGVTLDFSGAECGSGAAGTVAIAGGVIVSASVTNGGSGYAKLVYAAPTLSLSVSGGTGGVLTIDGYNKLSAGSDAYYGIGSVTVANGGSGYADNAQATITLGTGDEKLPPSATPVIRIRTEYRPPNDEWTLQQYDTNTWEPIPTIGTGLVISLTLAPDYAGSTDYEAASVAVVAGGSGHSVGEWFTAAAVEGGTEVEAELEITSVGSGGEVTGIELWLGGRFAGIDTGVIDRVEFGLGGWRGAYRKKTVEACSVTVNVVQATPATGSGAEITATVEDDESDPNFGKIIGLTAVDGGSGYSAGSGGELSVSLEQFPDTCGFDAWRVASIEVTAPGTGYQVGDTVKITAASGDTTVSTASATIEVDEDGGITAAPIGKWWDGWQVRYASGEYYRESKAATPYVASLTVTVNATQQPPGFGGVPAELTASVDTNPNSQTFGSVTSIAVNKGGAGYVALCESTRGVSDCNECPPRQQPELSSCYVESETGICGDWQSGFPSVEPPCCDSCLVRPNPPWPPSPTRTCVPTLDAVENTTGYGKTSRISGPPWDVLYGPVQWNEEWLAEHSACTLVWVEDYVEQTNATGTYCADWSSQQIHPDLIGTYVPPEGCYLLGTHLWCPTYTRRFWFRMRLFLVDCRDRTMREVTDEALTAPVERTGCVVPSGAFGLPLCDTLTGNYCLGANPGFLNAQPTLECAE